MTKSEKIWMENEIRNQLRCAVSDEYDNRILDYEVSNDDGDIKVTVMDMIIGDILETSAYSDEGYFSSSDLRYAIGRTLCKIIGIE